MAADFDINSFFSSLRHDKNHHLGLGDIRLTLGQQEEIAAEISKMDCLKWISIESQHPPFDTPVLVCWDSEICIARLIQKTINSTDISFEFYEGSSGYDLLWVTPSHWMPLPEMPSFKD